MATILLIEDDRDCAATIARILSPHRHVVHHATDGLAGLQLARESHPDLILVDMNLPDLKGEVVALQLRVLVGRSPVSLVAFTAESGTRARRLALAFGCDTFISKPIDTQTFPRQIDQILEQKRSRVNA
jgi:DNA-binding response OmpR family regulator